MKVKSSAIIRIVALAAVLINQVLAIFGKNLPFCDNVIYQVVSAVLTVIVAAYTAWKNNDFTKFARAAGSVFDALKDGKMTADDVEKIVKAFESGENVSKSDSADTENNVENNHDEKSADNVKEKSDITDDE